MAKKSKFLINPYTVLWSGTDYTTYSNIPGINSIEVKPPINMVITRVTFQLLQGGADINAVLISDHVSTNSYDGLLLTTNIEQTTTRSLPSNTFTFENFGDESISQSFFLSNVSVIPDNIYVVVIFEGFINE
jgi:hypothetical protein